MPKILIILSYLAYIIFCILYFKNIKIRFSAYPFIILNIFSGFYFYKASGLGTSNAVGLGYVFMYLFMFTALPIMVLALIIGAVFDIWDLIKK